MELNKTKCRTCGRTHAWDGYKFADTPEKQAHNQRNRTTCPYCNSTNVENVEDDETMAPYRIAAAEIARAVIDQAAGHTGVHTADDHRTIAHVFDVELERVQAAPAASIDCLLGIVRTIKTGLAAGATTEVIRKRLIDDLPHPKHDGPLFSAVLPLADVQRLIDRVRSLRGHGHEDRR